MSEVPAVTKNARGIKHKCLSCELPFYDLSRSPIVCPNCAEIFVPVVAPLPRSSESRPVSNARKAPWTLNKVTPAPDAEEEVLVDAGDEDEIEADDDTLLDPEAEIDDDEVVVAADGDEN